MSDILRATVLDPGDDVATALVDLPSGTQLKLRRGPFACEVTTAEPIALGHKFALHTLSPGQRVRKYGEFIGRATREIAPGAWVHLHNLETMATDVEAREVADVPSRPADVHPAEPAGVNSAHKRRDTDA